MPALNADRDVKEKFRSDSPLRSKNAHSTDFPAPPMVDRPTPASQEVTPMSLRFRLVMLILPAALFAASAGQAMAQDAGRERGNGRSEMGGPQTRGRLDRHDRRQDHRELSDAVRRVERQTGGQVLSAERVPFDGRNVNRVKVVDSSGRVRVYMDDPQTPRRPRMPPADDASQRDD